VIVVVANIPLALLGSLFGLWLTGNTINIMSLGGLALAIGILVDEATVEVENVHAQMRHSPKVASVVLHGNLITAVPRLLALLCILSVFIPAFIMGDPLRSLFMPLTLGVGFAMISSYLLSSTFVPIMCVNLLKPMGHHDESQGLFGRLLKVYGKLVNVSVRFRYLVVPIYLVACALVLWQLGLRVGTELFPQVDSRQFVTLREGSGIKLTEFRERLRKVLPERVVPWLAQRLEQGGTGQGGGDAAGRSIELRIRAGRHRDQTEDRPGRRSA
jgi:multidrug efflux pump subunit AcrB